MNAVQFDQCLKDGESLLKSGRELQQLIENECVAVQRLRDTATKTKEKLGKENINLEKTIEGEMSISTVILFRSVTTDLVQL